MVDLPFHGLKSNNFLKEENLRAKQDNQTHCRAHLDA